MSDKAHFTINGLLTSPRAGLLRLLAPVTGTLERVYLFADTGPVDGDAIFDVNINGTSIWNADQTQRPKIEDGDTTADKTGIAEAVTELTDVITVDFDGLTDDAERVGGKLIIVLFFTESSGGVADSGAFIAQEDVSASQQIASGSGFTQITFDTSVRDDGGYYNATDDTIILPADGWYVITAQITWEGNATGERRLVLKEEYVPSPGVFDPIEFAQVRHAASSSADMPQQISAVRYFLEDMRITVWGSQNSGSSLFIRPNNSGGGGFERTWVAVTPGAQR